MKEEFKKYLAMILAVFCTAALSILFFFILFRMDALRSLIGKILNILMPFIYGAGIAYVLKPLCNTYERFLNKHWHPKRQKLIGTVSVIGSIVTGLVVMYSVVGCRHRVPFRMVKGEYSSVYEYDPHRFI